MRILLVLVVLQWAGCGGEIDSGMSTNRVEEGLSGCRGKADSGIPSDGNYFLTSFGFSSSDDGLMSCGTRTLHGSWYYAASRQRYGCGSRIRITANGKCVVAKTDDYGPDECVERAAGRPIIDASPLVSLHLFGSRSAGWSDRFAVHAVEVATSTPLGPCDGTTTPPDPPPSGASGCHSGTLEREVASGTCVQSASDAAWYHCADGSWLAGKSGCTVSYGWCRSDTLGKEVAPRSCVESRFDGKWYQCTSSGWAAPVANGAGPLGNCAAEYSL